jgi:hypothetical protein
MSDPHDLRWTMPKRADWPKHELRKLTINSPVSFLPRPTYRLDLTPWRAMSNQWWSLARSFTFRGEPFLFARVYVNGNGNDHELRFTVWDPFTSSMGPHGSEPKYGAANAWIRVDEPLEGQLELNRRWRNRKPALRTRPEVWKCTTVALGGRGLADHYPEDVLTVMRWCDEKIEEILDPWIFAEQEQSS